MITRLLSKTDLSSSQQHHAALHFNVVLLQNVQILLTTIVAVHKFPLQPQAQVKASTSIHPIAFWDLFST